VNYTEAYNLFEVTEIRGTDAIPEFECGYGDQQVRERHSDSPRLIFSIEEARVESNRDRDRIDGHCRHDFLDEFFSPRFPFQTIRTSGAMRQFDEGDDRYSNLGLTDFTGNG
jgi:hypothetical protein